MFALLQQDLVPPVPLERWIQDLVSFLTKNLRDFFQVIKAIINGFVGVFDAVLSAPPEMIMVAILVAIAFFLTNPRMTRLSVAGFVLGVLLLLSYGLWGGVTTALAGFLPALLALMIVFVPISLLFLGARMAVFSVLGFVLLISLQLWSQSMLTLALVLSSAIVALIIGVPLGILAAKSRAFEAAVRPTLDVMQTMPAFVYLVPMIVFLGLGNGPSLFATVIFATPPAVRLTLLGIQQVPQNTVEAAQAFGATPWQTLRKVELPQALPTIMAGVNQVIMLSLSMTVIAALVGGGGLGESVVQGLSQLNTGQAFVGGVGIVIIAIYLDRVTRGLSRAQQYGGAKRGLRLKGVSKLLPGTKADPAAAGTGAEETAQEGAAR